MGAMTGKGHFQQAGPVLRGCQTVTGVTVRDCSMPATRPQKRIEHAQSVQRLLDTLFSAGPAHPATPEKLGNCVGTIASSSVNGPLSQWGIPEHTPGPIQRSRVWKILPNIELHARAVQSSRDGGTRFRALGDGTGRVKYEGVALAGRRCSLALLQKAFFPVPSVVTARSRLYVSCGQLLIGIAQRHPR